MVRSSVASLGDEGTTGEALNSGERSDGEPNALGAPGVCFDKLVFGRDIEGKISDGTALGQILDGSGPSSGLLGARLGLFELKLGLPIPRPLDLVAWRTGLRPPELPGPRRTFWALNLGLLTWCAPGGKRRSGLLPNGLLTTLFEELLDVR